MGPVCVRIRIVTGNTPRLVMIISVLHKKQLVLSLLKIIKEYEPRQEKTCLCHMRTTKAQISAFAVRCLDSIIPLVSLSKFSSLYLVSVADQAGLSINWSQNPEDRFSHDEAHIKTHLNVYFLLK